MMTADYIQKFMGSMILSAGIHLINPISFTNRDTKNGGKEMKEKEKKIQTTQYMHKPTWSYHIISTKIKWGGEG